MSTPTNKDGGDDTLCLMVEILTCKHLMIRDKRTKSSDPYVKVKLGGKDLHQTKTIVKKCVKLLFYASEFAVSVYFVF